MSGQMPVDFPPVVVRKILLHAAQSSASSCRALCEVSTWVRHLALPFRYITIPINVVGSIICSRPVCSPSPGFDPQTVVRHIWALDESEEWEKILQCCTRVSHLAISETNLIPLSDATMRLQRATAHTPSLINGLHVLILHWRDPYSYSKDSLDGTMHGNFGDTGPYFFQCITHLRLEDPIQLAYLRLGQMNRLTHLAAPWGKMDEDWLMKLFEVLDMPVEMFVLVVSLDDMPEDTCQKAENLVCRIRKNFKRGVVFHVVRPLYDVLKDEWNAEVRGGPTIWERAVKYTQELMDRMYSGIDLTMPINLPLELVREIFLYAAASSSSSCRVLCQVSTWVRHCVLPLLYATASISRKDTLIKFHELVTSERVTCPPTAVFRPADAVRNLYITTDSSRFEFIIQHCDNVTHLAIHSWDITRFMIATVPPSPNSRVRQKVHGGTNDLQILLFDRYDGWLISDANRIGYPLFSRITHLRLGMPFLIGFEELILCMPRLTHFAAPFDDSTEESLNAIFHIITHPPLLAFVLVLSYEHLNKEGRQMVENWVREAHRMDPRIYAVRQQYSKLEKEWDAEVRGGTTIWKRAADYTRRLVDRPRFDGF
ncbi:hypothetical protein BD779DRAFT_1561277 [Infundibulicybe gibba]|nr:hypothetical protein BD779DRAFT_1561277 [Infundibulicybe gibba]